MWGYVITLDKSKDDIAVDILDELLDIDGINFDVAKEILKAIKRDELKQLILKYLGE